jgi:hypothetical protein
VIDLLAASLFSYLLLPELDKLLGQEHLGVGVKVDLLKRKETLVLKARLHTTY